MKKRFLVLATILSLLLLLVTFWEKVALLLYCRKSIERSVVKNPDDPILNYLLGKQNYKNKIFNKSRSFFKKAAEKFPENKPHSKLMSHANAGNSGLKMAGALLNKKSENQALIKEKAIDSLKEAIKDYNKALNLQTDNKEVLANKEVAESLLKMLEQDPEKDQSQNNQKNQNKDNQSQDKNENKDQSDSGEGGEGQDQNNKKSDKEQESKNKNQQNKDSQSDEQKNNQNQEGENQNNEQQDQKLQPRDNNEQQQQQNGQNGETEKQHSKAMEQKEEGEKSQQESEQSSQESEEEQRKKEQEAKEVAAEEQLLSDLLEEGSDESEELSNPDDKTKEFEEKKEGKMLAKLTKQNSESEFNKLDKQEAKFGKARIRSTTGLPGVARGQKGW